MSLLNLILPTHAKIARAASTTTDHAARITEPPAPPDYAMDDWVQFLMDHLHEENWAHAEAIAEEIRLRCHLLALESKCDAAGVVPRSAGL